MPEGAVHGDVLPHRLQYGVLGGVPVQVGLLLVDVLQLSHGLAHSRVQSIDGRLVGAAGGVTVTVTVTTLNSNF